MTLEALYLGMTSTPHLCMPLFVYGSIILHRKADLEVLPLQSCYTRFVTLQLAYGILETS